MTSTNKLVQILKSTQQDFEFYPTLPEIISLIKADLEIHYNTPSVLDVGAGNGQTLKALTDGTKYAIEKSVPLINELDSNIFIIGTDFNEQSLFDKKVDVIFSNPPYSCFEQWLVKIIEEANAQQLYFVAPLRWKNSQHIIDALEGRESEAKVLGTFDFSQGERAARVEVDVIKIDLVDRSYYSRSETPRVDAFKTWFEKHFKIEIGNKDDTESQKSMSKSENLSKEVNQELVENKNIISMLAEFYQRDLDKLLMTYKGLEAVDGGILKELNVSIDGVRKALELKVKSLKDVYWKELFNKLNTITDKLTAKSRKDLLSTLTAHTHVDFTTSNARAILGWVIKNANTYLDDQLVTTVTKMITKASVTAYKSNKRTFQDEDWRYNRAPDLERFKLDYRIVLSRIGGLNTGWGSGVNGLSECAATFLDDLCTIAANVCFDTVGTERSRDFHWNSGGKKTFQYRDINTGKLETLFTAKAYLNGNLHLSFTQKLMCRLNVEMGRLRGWVKSPKEAAEEMDIKVEDAISSFSSNLLLTSENSLLQIGFKQAA
jgi:hypothetical protein